MCSLVRRREVRWERELDGGLVLGEDLCEVIKGIILLSWNYIKLYEARQMGLK